MTTVIATRKAIYADTLCNYTVPFKVTKIARIGKSLFAGAGDTDEIEKFFAWKRGDGDAPEIEETLDVLEVAPDGMFIYGKKLVRLKVNESVYSIGSGSQYAMGAVAMGASPEKAIEIAAKFDNCTRPPVDVVYLKGK